MACPPPKNEFFYFDKNGLMVFTEKYHLNRGYCCKNGCRHCPYGFKEGKPAEPKPEEKSNDSKA